MSLTQMIKPDPFIKVSSNFKKIHISMTKHATRIHVWFSVYIQYSDAENSGPIIDTINISLAYSTVLWLYSTYDAVYKWTYLNTQSSNSWDWWKQFLMNSLCWFFNILYWYNDTLFNHSILEVVTTLWRQKPPKIKTFACYSTVVTIGQ